MSAPRRHWSVWSRYFGVDKRQARRLRRRLGGHFDPSWPYGAWWDEASHWCTEGHLTEVPRG